MLESDCREAILEEESAERNAVLAQMLGLLEAIADSPKDWAGVRELETSAQSRWERRKSKHASPDAARVYGIPLGQKVCYFNESEAIELLGQMGTEFAEWYFSVNDFGEQQVDRDSLSSPETLRDLLRDYEGSRSYSAAVREERQNLRWGTLASRVTSRKRMEAAQAAALEEAVWDLTGRLSLYIDDLMPSPYDGTAPREPTIEPLSHLFPIMKDGQLTCVYLTRSTAAELLASFGFRGKELKSMMDCTQKWFQYGPPDTNKQHDSKTKMPVYSSRFWKRLSQHEVTFVADQTGKFAGVLVGEDFSNYRLNPFDYAHAGEHGIETELRHQERLQENRANAH